MNPVSQPTAKFKFGAVPTARRLTFSFNVYSFQYPQASAQTIQRTVAGALSAWDLIGGTSGVRVTQLAGLGFFAVTLSANVYSTYSNAEAARGLVDDLSRSFAVSNLTVNGANPSASTTTTAGASGTYTVVAGDTLSRIAARFGTTWQTLAALNNLSNPNALEVGQVLRITGSATPSAPQQTAPPPPVITTGGSAPPPSTLPTPPKSGIENWAGKLGLSVSALALLGVVAAMVVVSRRN